MLQSSMTELCTQHVITLITLVHERKACRSVKALLCASARLTLSYLLRRSRGISYDASCFTDLCATVCFPFLITIMALCWTDTRGSNVRIIADFQQSTTAHLSNNARIAALVCTFEQVVHCSAVSLLTMCKHYSVKYIFTFVVNLANWIYFYAMPRHCFISLWKARWFYSNTANSFLSISFAGFIWSALVKCVYTFDM